LANAAPRQPLDPGLPAPPSTLGLAEFARAVFGGEDLTGVWDTLMARATGQSADVGAMLDLSTILQLVGQRDQGLALQADALGRQRLFRRTLGTGEGPRLLALLAPGDMMANTPLEFLLKGWNGRLDLVFTGPAQPLPAELPDHDLAILAIGESDANAALLRTLAGPIARWPRPVLNGAPLRVLGLGRDCAPQALAGLPGLDAPPARRTTRAELEALGLGATRLEDMLPGRRFPAIVRPVGSHAGIGLEKLDRPGALEAYLEGQAAERFYLSPFVDYRSPDGLYRKLRIALVDGQPFISHMAVSSHWMVHYLNAGMGEDAGKRAEEAALMAGFDRLAERHGAAFRGLCDVIGLDYFAIDCAEAPDGRLLIFEADTAMIVHDMDPPDLYPYKGPAMAKLFAAFQALVGRMAGA
jgi:hypothetical protein